MPPPPPQRTDQRTDKRIDQPMGKHLGQRLRKRTFDLLVALPALLVLALPMLLLALLIRWDSPGPALYRQERVGRHGRLFRIHKFRTMHELASPGASSLQVTPQDDQRITRLGRWLRARRIDELPQLIDVVLGHMSLVGPRPEVPRYLVHYPEPLRAQILSVRPGITDPAALAHRDEGQLLGQAADPDRCYIHTILPTKLAQQAAYIQTATMASDVRVLWATLGVLLQGRPARLARPARPARLARQLGGLLVDAAVVWLAWQATYLFRLGFDRWLSARAPYDAAVALGVVALYMALLLVAGSSRGLWRYTGFADIRRLSIVCLVGGLVAASVVAGALQLGKVPRSVLALHPFVCLIGLCLVRLLTRMVYEDLRSRRSAQAQTPRRALVLGAGEAARRLVAGIQGQGWDVLGLLDDDPLKQGSSVVGRPVVGRMADLADRVATLGPTHLILALPSLRGSKRRLIIDQAARCGLPLLTVPSADELRAGSQAARVRDIQPDDVLGRDPVDLDETAVAGVLDGAVVLVTGAGGSIGSELCHQLARFRPARLVALDQSEFALYRIEQQLRERHPGLAVTPLVVDVKDEAMVRAALQRHQPSVLFHAAAYKHVPMVEVGNALAALRNNALGTRVVARAAADAGVARFVLISTDKAVNPSNVMGATKRVAELFMADLARTATATRFITVRFGNVLGSTGSVIPRFKDQIARGGPVTVTHPDMIRYFMTIPEACRLVLQAAELGQGADVLILDMGEPVRIVDLARSMIRLSGASLEDIPIVYSGLRPGEKLFEELTGHDEQTQPTRVAAIRAARLRPPPAASVIQAWL